MSRRRSSTPQLLTIYWRDIPAQITASSGREQAKALLTDRFQHAIDRAATVAGLTDTDSYVNEWRRETVEIGGEIDHEADAAAAQLEAAYPRERLEALVRNGGIEPDPTHTPESPDPVGGPS